MTRAIFLPHLTGAATILAVGACQSSHVPPAGPTVAPYVIEAESRSLTLPPPPTPSPRCLPAPRAAPTPTEAAGAPRGTYPTAAWVPGRPGMVVNPFGGTGLIDVTGLPPGSMARDPYSGNVFLIPVERP